MKTSLLSLLLLVVLVLGSTLVLPADATADEKFFIKMMDHTKYHNTGADFYEAGQYSKALYFLDKAIQTEPRIPISYEVKAMVYLKLKQYNKAWDNVKKAQSLTQPVFDAYGKKMQSKAYEVDPVFLEELRKASGRNE